MSRSAMLTGSFYPHSHGQHGHYGVHAPNHYDGLIHPGLAFARPPLPMCVPVLPPAGFNHQHTGQHQHQHQHPHPHGRTSTFNMNESAYTPSDEEFAHLQKLSNEYQPDAIVSACVDDDGDRVVGKDTLLTITGPACWRAPEQRGHNHRVRQRRPRLQNKDGCSACQIRLLPHLSRRRPLRLARSVALLLLHVCLY